MSLDKEILEKAKKAASAEELNELAKENGITLSESEAESYFGFLHDKRELSDEELSQVAGGKEGKYCTTAPTPFCTGSGFLCGLDACSNYVEVADPNSMPTAYTYPVLCSCLRDHYTNVPMQRPYQA